jgi:hypothetical protein
MLVTVGRMMLKYHGDVVVDCDEFPAKTTACVRTRSSSEALTKKPQWTILQPWEARCKPCTKMIKIQ